MKATERKKLETLFGALDVLIDETSESMPLRQAQAFLSVAIREAKEGAADMRDVGADTGAPSAVASRDLLGLGKRQRSGKSGLGLVVVKEDYTDLRRRPYVLTPKGNKAINALLGAL